MYDQKHKVARSAAPMSDDAVPPPVSEPAAAPVAEEAAGGASAESPSDAPPAPPPPGFEDVAPGTHAVPPAELDALASAVQAARVTPAEQADVDAPDLSLKSGVLLEEEVTEIKTVLAADATPYTSAKTFEDLNLSPELLKGLYKEMGFSKPSKVQAQTLPMILSGPPFRNLVAQAHNGSGKTTCFVLGMLSRCDPSVAKPQALCVCPTRELVVQNVEVLRKMATHTRISCAAALKEPQGRPAASSRMEPVADQVVIGTPGTVNGWIVRKTLSLSALKMLVFDEADQMWGEFSPECLKILKASIAAGARAQVLLFSATFSDHVRAIAQKLVGPQANTILVPREKLSLDVIKQYRVNCPSIEAKEAVLKDMIFPAAEKLGQSIVFVRSRVEAHRLHRTLEREGFKCTSIAGDLPPEQRDLVISEFRSGTTKILIATDVLSRGFDHATVTLVINYDPPMSQSGHPAFETYMHRIGRSGRFGRKGAAFNFVATQEERRTVDAIAAHFQRDIPEVPYNQEEAFERVLKEAGLA